MYKLTFTETYEKKVRRFLKKHPEIIKQYQKTLELLELNPYHPSLRLHQFTTSNFKGYSVSINLSYRIAIDFLIENEEIIPVNIGNHKDIYAKV